MTTLSPNVWNLGDVVATRRTGDLVTIRRFVGSLVEVEWPDGARMKLPHDSLRRVG